MNCKELAFIGSQRYCAEWKQWRQPTRYALRMWSPNWIAHFSCQFCLTARAHTYTYYCVGKPIAAIVHARPASAAVAAATAFGFTGLSARRLSTKVKTNDAISRRKCFRPHSHSHGALHYCGCGYCCQTTLVASEVAAILLNCCWTVERLTIHLLLEFSGNVFAIKLNCSLLVENCNLLMCWCSSVVWCWWPTTEAESFFFFSIFWFLLALR